MIGTFVWLHCVGGKGIKKGGNGLILIGLIVIGLTTIGLIVIGLTANGLRDWVDHKGQPNRNKILDLTI